MIKLLIGFIIFLAICVMAFYTKKWTEEVLLKREVKEIYATMISDAILFTVVFGSAILTAPYMW
jgi:hypothetical protein